MMHTLIQQKALTAPDSLPLRRKDWLILRENDEGEKSFCIPDNDIHLRDTAEGLYIENRSSEKVTLSYKKKIVVKLNNVDNYYFDMSLKEFLGGLTHTFTL